MRTTTFYVAQGFTHDGDYFSFVSRDRSKRNASLRNIENLSDIKLGSVEAFDIQHAIVLVANGQWSVAA